MASIRSRENVTLPKRDGLNSVTLPREITQIEGQEELLRLRYAPFISS